MLDESVYRKRMERVSGFLEKAQVDLGIVTPSAAFQYLTGIQREMSERLIALLINPENRPQIVAPAFEVSTLSDHTWIEEFLPWAEDVDPYTVVANQLSKSQGNHSIAFEETLPLGVYWSLEKAVGGFSKQASLTSLIDDMRLFKTEEELAPMRRAGQIINDAVLKAFNEAHVGMTELEVQQIVRSEVTRQGAVPTFSAIQFGEKSALPHASAGARELKKCDIVLMDCGCTMDGYNTDMTRVGVVGAPSEEQELIHSIVLKAQQSAIERITNGLACGAADGVSRRIIEEAGYGAYFTHRLGHGIGLQVHEPPYLVRGNSTELRPGMTHSVEPGIYLEGKFGIRIEDLVCVRDGAPEVLTYMSRDLFIIEG
ncbi:MAG: M24 family metallopeptidase [Candidatus Thorarchaeota archaeon]|jgi:Xaa-Pro dipeptidase